MDRYKRNYNSSEWAWIWQVIFLIKYRLRPRLCGENVTDDQRIPRLLLSKPDTGRDIAITGLHSQPTPNGHPSDNLTCPNGDGNYNSSYCPDLPELLGFMWYFPFRFSDFCRLMKIKNATARNCRPEVSNSIFYIKLGMHCL